MALPDTCPKCGKETWRFNLYMHFTAPARFYGAMNKRNLRKAGVECQAALWETASFFCVNPKCMHFTRPAKQVRLEEIDGR